MGGARAADAHALLGARRPARGLDRRHAADRARSASAAGATAGSRCRSSPPSRPAILVASRAGQPPARSRPARARAALGDRTLARWLASELLANAAWAGTLVYAGALFVESYGTSTGLTGCLLAVAAGAYVAGNLTCRRLVASRAAARPRPARRPPRRHRRPVRRGRARTSRRARLCSRRGFVAGGARSSRARSRSRRRPSCGRP